MHPIEQTQYVVDQRLMEKLDSVTQRVQELRSNGRLDEAILAKVRKFFRIKSIHHSNGIEGNILKVGETRMVVEQGLTLSGVPLKDQFEARNLAHAIDFLDELASDPNRSILENDIRQLHQLVLEGIHDDFAGVYRSINVEIGGSKFKPTPVEQVNSAMNEFGEWLISVTSPNRSLTPIQHFLNAAVAHTWFVTIHPFVDGNGRVSRLLLNLMLMRSGFPIAVITTEDKFRYYDSLEASQSSDLSQFVDLLCECVGETLEEYESAIQDADADSEWASQMAAKMGAKTQQQARNPYEIWRGAMDLFSSQFKQTIDLINQRSNTGEIVYREFSAIEFEKYAALKSQRFAKKTWFFRVDFFEGGKVVARYMFFFGFPSYWTRQQCDVTIHLSRESPPGSFNYTPLDAITTPDVPNFYEIGYSANEERFVVLRANKTTEQMNVSELCRSFVTDVINKHFGRV